MKKIQSFCKQNNYFFIKIQPCYATVNGSSLAEGIDGFFRRRVILLQWCRNHRQLLLMVVGGEITEEASGDSLQLRVINRCGVMGLDRGLWFILEMTNVGTRSIRGGGATAAEEVFQFWATVGENRQVMMGGCSVGIAFICKRLNNKIRY